MSADENMNTTPVDNDYASRTGQKEHIPVQKDEEPVEDPIDAEEADTDKALGMCSILIRHQLGHEVELTKSTEADEAAAIDESNIVDGRTRGATKPSGTYTEPSDGEELPTQDGTSSTA